MNKVLDTFLQELAENDKKVQAESYEKNGEKISQEFVDFIQNKHCKVKEERHGNEDENENQD